MVVHCTMYRAAETGQSPTDTQRRAVAEFIDPRLGDKVNSGIGFSYRPSSPCSLAACRTGPPVHVAWRAGTTTLRRS
jgi:hypothetical protein